VDAVLTRVEGFYWVVLGQNPPEGRLLGTGRVVARWNVKPWQPEAVTVICDRLIFRPRTALR
jgi:hypothetical protein